MSNILSNSPLIFLGDIAFNGILSEQPYENPARFAQISPLLQKASMVFANLEVPVKVNDDKNEYKNFIHYSLSNPTEELLQLLNIGCVSLANNHIYDCKMSGLKETIGILDKLGIFHTGAGWKKEHTDPVIIQKNGLKIGFIAYVYKSTNPKTEAFNDLFINYFNIEKVVEDIKALKPKVDKVICSVHWGIDYSHYPTEQQRVIARKLVDAGVSVIMGHHPHTLQPFEKYKDGTIFYSLGGLTFGDFLKDGKKELQALFRKTKYGLIANFDLEASKMSFVSTHEKKGNFVSIIKRDYIQWSNGKWRCYKLKENHKVINRMVVLKEQVIDRVLEYFFGYYRTPFLHILEFNNYKKIKYMIRDYKNNKQ